MESNGNLNIIAQKLDLGDSYFNELDDELYVVFVDPAKGFRFDMPNGNEIGAYEGLWVPGGKTGNGTLEAVILDSDNLVHNNNWSEILKYYGEDNVKLIKKY